MFPDTSTISISPGTEVSLADFTDNETEQSLILNLVPGTARTVTGEVSRRTPAAFIINTPQASVGIRGTIATVSAQGDITRIFLTETSGQGVTVRALNTGKSTEMRMPGNLITVGPSGMEKRRANTGEAQNFNAALRGGEPSSTISASFTSADPAGRAIPLWARITAIADVYDALFPAAARRHGTPPTR